jgi:CRISPR-associated protein Csx10
LLDAETPITITTITDWHVGTGTGLPGDIDALVRRDADGLPYLPGTSLTGVLREACRVVARALDDGAEDGVWQRHHRAVFGGPDRAGTPRPALVGIAAARLPPRLRRELAASPRWAAATTTVRAGVRIDPESGRADDGMLRFVELARGGLPLESTLFMSRAAGTAEPDATAATALLVLAAAWCDRLGGDRRRGPGEVRIELAGQRADAWAGWLAASGWVPGEPVPAGAPVPVPAARPAAPGGGWRVLDLTVTTLDPVRVPRSTAGNVVRGHDHLPGSVLLPWLAARLGGDLVRDAVAAQALCVRNAHPEVAGERGLPVPFSMFRARTAAAGDLAADGPVPGSRQVRDRWTVQAPRGDRLPLQVPGTAQVSHNAIDPDRQTPTSETGIFEVETIPAGRRLRGRLLVSDGAAGRFAERHGERWWEVLRGAARLGSRRHGEYGGVVMGLGPPAEPPPAVAPAAEFTLWAGTDLLVRDRRLRPSADPEDVARVLTAQLGTPVELAGVTARTGRRESWHAGWGLPRESLVGIGAGSVLRMRVAAPAEIDPAGWRDLHLVGIGERRAEGFGEVLLDAPLLTAGPLTASDVEPVVVTTPGPKGPLDAAERAALDRLGRVVVRDRVVDALTAARGGPDQLALRAALKQLSRSQRGAWRAVTADAALAAEPARVLGYAEGWLAHGDERRADQRATARVLTGLLGGYTEQRPVAELLAEHGVTGLTPADVTFAVAVLVADTADELRRGPR